MDNTFDARVEELVQESMKNLDGETGYRAGQLVYEFYLENHEEQLEGITYLFDQAAANRFTSGFEDYTTKFAEDFSLDLACLVARNEELEA